MKNTLSIILLIISSTLKILAQDQMIVDKPAGLKYYDGYGKLITSLSEVPANIVDSTKKALTLLLGDLSIKTKFQYGQIIDLKAYRTSKYRNRVSSTTPRYDLEFILKDLTIAIKSYPVEIRLDESGHLLTLNWPRKGYKSKSIFLPTDTIKAYTLKQAAILNFNQEDYKVDFKYDYNEQKFIWIFLFPATVDNNNSKNYNVIEINWADLSDFRITKLRQVVVY